MFFYISAVVGVLGLVFFFLVVILFYFNPLLHSKSTAFECGFQPFLFTGYVFSMPFFVICLMFLLFDVEIVLMCFPSFLGVGFFTSFWCLILLILFATCYEWKGGVLSWI